MRSPYKGRLRDFIAGFHNSLTLLSAELEGRTYGGGVLELVPSEVGRLLVPLAPLGKHLRDLDNISRKAGGQADSDDALVAGTDELLLRVIPEAKPIFDTIIAADVLEHVLELEALVGELHRLLVPGGELLVSAPSENRFYELGRRVFGYTKPDDHFHPASFIEATVGQRLPMAQRRYFPFNLAPLAVFSLGRYVRPDRQEAAP